MNDNKIRPLADRIIVKRQKAEERSEGGIIIPDNAKKKVSRGEVLAVGPGRIDDNGARIEPGVKAGNVVIFGDYSGTEVKLDGDDLLVIREDDVLGVLEQPGV